ncbi:MAG: hypothetical protein GX772_10705, partial [Alcaligenaceae bacterium]|nr:hypothetical protein [Alcaligenaceae bacterium]
MKQLSYTVRFLTPAFLGNADQIGQWRTPPFKALLRQWWRVAVAPEMKFDTDAIRKREGELFGVAADSGGSRKSQVRIRLGHWDEGTLNQAPRIGDVSLGKNQIPAALYSGYGPIMTGPRLKARAAIQSGAETQLHIAFPENACIEEAICLMNAYGTAGGRSRNGWGSFELEGEKTDVPVFAHDWKMAMDLDWPHALGRDEQGVLIWQSAPQADWEKAMRLLAQARADMRRYVPDRLMLASPSGTRETLPGWDKNERVPNSLRFKVRSEGARFIAVIFHMPCLPADSLMQKLRSHSKQDFIRCFTKTHEFLDQHSQFQRAK